MDMGGSSMSSGPACKISMMWNWYTIDACFLARSWHVRTKAQFAGSVVGVFFLCMAIEGVRRLGREYDRKLIAAAKNRAAIQAGAIEVVGKDAAEVPCGTTFEFVPSWIQHLIRSLAYGSQFTAAFLVMLLGMYYNGAILLAIFSGQTVGYLVFGRDTCTASIDHVASGSCC